MIVIAGSKLGHGFSWYTSRSSIVNNNQVYGAIGFSVRCFLFGLIFNSKLEGTPIVCTHSRLLPPKSAKLSNSFLNKCGKLWFPKGHSLMTDLDKVKKVLSYFLKFYSYKLYKNFTDISNK